MGFIEKQAEEWVLADLLDTLDTLEQDMNLQIKQINELVIEDSRKEKYITDDVNIVRDIVLSLDFEQRAALQNLFYQMEQHFYFMNRSEEEEQDFIKNVAKDINDLPTAKFAFDDEEEEDDWTDLSDVDIN